MYSKLSKLGNIMRTEILNSSIKDGLKIVSKTKVKNYWSTVYHEIYSKLSKLGNIMRIEILNSEFWHKRLSKNFFKN